MDDLNANDYIRKRLEMSTFTGIPQIVQARNRFSRYFKVIILLLCIIGFIYQVYEFLIIFLDYPTTQVVTMERPTVIDTPAFTICNSNEINRTAFCNAYPKWCDWKQLEDVCEKFPRYCVSDEPKNRSIGIPKKFWIFKDPDEDFFNTYREQTTIAVVYHYNTSKTEYSYINNYSNVTVIYHDEVHLCITLFSLFEKPNGEAMAMDMRSVFRVILSMHPEEYMDPNETVQAYISIHDPKRLSNPFIEGFPLFADHRYKLHVSKRITERLPPPYKTNCKDYFAMWKEEGGRGPMTKKDCADFCEILKRYGCANYRVPYPHDHKRCNSFKNFGVKNYTKHCSDRCQEGCRVETYSLNEKEVLPKKNLDKKVCKGSANYCKNKLLRFEIVFNDVIHNIKYDPKYENVEIFSSIGGYLGLWMSVIVLFDFLEMVVKIISHLILRKMKKKENILPICFLIRDYDC